MIDGLKEPVILSVDIGGSKYMVGFVDANGQILYKRKLTWKGTSPDEVLSQLKEAIAALISDFPDLYEITKAGGLTIPGFADPVKGVWVDSDFIIIQNMPICDLLGEEFKLPFYCDNDGNACALAEKYFGSAKDNSDFLYMTVSTGIGGASYLSDKLYYGDKYNAGEIGQFVVEEYGRPSDTGSVNGIVEVYASGRGLSMNYGNDTLGGEEITDLFYRGDKKAIEAIALEGKYLGRIIANACTLASFERIILGGGISMIFDKYRDELIAEFKRILPKREVVIEATSLGYYGAFLGAAAVALRGLDGFKGDAGSGGNGENTYVITVGSEVVASHTLGENSYSPKGASLGDFLIATHIDEKGESLKSLVNNPDRIVEATAKAAASACVFFDPGKLVVNFEDKSLVNVRERFMEVLTRETYYRGNFPFEIEIG